MNTAEIYNYKKISDLIVTSGLLNEEQLATLAGEGFELVINLLPDEHDYAVKTEANIVQGQGIDYHYIPVEYDKPLVDDYQQFEAVMLANNGKKMLIHCAANYRVSAFYAIYAVKHLNWSTEQAYEHVASMLDLSEYPQWQRFVADIFKD
jgi:uncharacterized protein (TIGR01244 family)